MSANCVLIRNENRNRFTHPNMSGEEHMAVDSVLGFIEHELRSGLEGISGGVLQRAISMTRMGDLFLDVRNMLRSLHTRVSELTQTNVQQLSEIYLISMKAAAQFDSAIEAGLMFGMDMSATMLVDCEHFSIDALKKDRARCDLETNVSSFCTEVDFAGEFDDCVEGPWCDISKEEMGGYRTCWVQWLYWCAELKRTKKRSSSKEGHQSPKTEHPALKRVRVSSS